MNRAVADQFGVAFLEPVAINFGWEMAQSVLFAPMGWWASSTWRCL